LERKTIRKLNKNLKKVKSPYETNKNKKSKLFNDKKVKERSQKAALKAKGPAAMLLIGN
jgi:hypothetical protein